MSYQMVISHIQRILNKCGDPVVLIPTGNQLLHESGRMVIEIRRVTILRKNNCCTMPPPMPICADNPPDEYWINRIRISPSMADDYSKGFPYQDEELRNLICSHDFLFGCFPV